MNAPDRSLDQRRRALAHGNRIRTIRARLKVRIGADETWRTAALAAANDVDALGLEAGILDSMKVWDAVIAAPGLGRVKVNGIFTRHRISPSKTIAGMTRRQRDELVEDLAERAYHAGRITAAELRTVYSRRLGVAIPEEDQAA